MGRQTQDYVEGDLVPRLRRAIDSLAGKQDLQEEGSPEWYRLEGKIQGVNLALSYIYERN
jgi:hypothetical protein